MTPVVTMALTVPLYFSAHDVENGYSLVIDRRKDKWSAVKSLLNKISVSGLINDSHLTS